MRNQTFLLRCGDDTIASISLLSYDLSDNHAPLWNLVAKALKEHYTLDNDAEVRESDYHDNTATYTGVLVGSSDGESVEYPFELSPLTNYSL